MDSRVALVTGASSGIGEATVLELIRRGFVVYAGARRVERMAHLAEHGARVIRLDVTDDESMSAAVTGILNDQGRIDVLVNNAGYGSYGAVEDVPIDEARRQFEVNIFGLARLTQLVLPTMRRQRRGTIVNISSIGGRIYEPLGAWYHATKYAVEGLSNSLRVEVEPHGVRVVLIRPGAIRTEWNEISRRSALEVSGDTAYAAQAHALVRTLSAADGETAAGPAVVAEAIGRAVDAAKPRIRYTVPFAAKAIVFARWLLPDRVFDAAVNRVFGVTAADRLAAEESVAGARVERP
ncbi:short-subunit dehydrogenase [Microbacterium sp. AK009]|uniref:oxidoreductase n=1 Tax=Microbacterium sp. AK009 TaxID=2723068 RepID=UPI0015CC909A|nr:oxidoreductase [Microbacterium sp. AK009]NYF15433.1 short-subunit dehydrogenase [Microbacterium sp. AK009]